MEETGLTIAGLIAESHQTARLKGWWESPRSFGDIVALCHTELSEAFEAYRAGHDVRLILVDENGKPDGVPVELADLLIRIADFCGEYDVPLEAALKQKLAYNRTRPHRHGGKRV